MKKKIFFRHWSLGLQISILLPELWRTLCTYKEWISFSYIRGFTIFSSPENYKWKNKQQVGLFCFQKPFLYTYTFIFVIIQCDKWVGSIHGDVVDLECPTTPLFLYLQWEEGLYLSNEELYACVPQVAAKLQVITFQVHKYFY